MLLRKFMLMPCFFMHLCLAQTNDWSVDFLSSYYDQDGEHSPVTGGIGTEDLQTIGPIIIIGYEGNESWSYQATLGLDNISSASTDNIDMNISSASSKDNRVFANASAARKFSNQTLRFSLGFSKEYDYRSLNGGIFWSRDFNQKNTNFGVGINHFEDEVELYDIDGVLQGAADRESSDVTLSLSQVLSPNVLAIFELYGGDQSGFLSTPFHEVHFSDGSIAAERLPDSRQRWAFKIALNMAITDKIIFRTYARHYEDDWGIDAQTVEFEPHFRLPLKNETWLYPILRYHTQAGSDYWGPAETLASNQLFATADWDIGSFSSEKFGLGFRTKVGSWFTDYLDARVTRYQRDGEFSSTTFSIGFGWSW